MTTTPKVLILRSPGTNCEMETAHAFELAGGDPEFLHVNRLVESPEAIDEYQILCIPGGFSYGDDVGAGKILASQFRNHLRDAVERFRDAGKLVLGICNGFQVLIKTGFLVPLDHGGLPVTLTWNNNGRYTCRWVTLKSGKGPCVFTRGLDVVYLPVAHAEGRFVTRDAEIMANLQSSGRVALRYVNDDGSNGNVPFPANPNGSDGHVAGICDESGRVFGLMPHPERHVDRTHHPRWTREVLSRTPDGLGIFRNAIRWFE